MGLEEVDEGLEVVGGAVEELMMNSESGDSRRMRRGNGEGGVLGPERSVYFSIEHNVGCHTVGKKKTTPGYKRCSGESTTIVRYDYI